MQESSSQSSAGELHSGKFHSFQQLSAILQAYPMIPQSIHVHPRSKIPQGKSTYDAESCLDAMIKGVEWSSREYLHNFRRLLYPIVDTFLEESQDNLHQLHHIRVTKHL